MNSDEHEQLRRTVELYRPIARTASLGRRNSKGLLIFGVPGLLLSLAGFDPAGFAIGAVVVLAGVVELRASRRLAAADPSAPKILARNELFLMAGIILYSLLKLTVLSESGEELVAKLGATGLGIDAAELTEFVSTLIYEVFIAVTLIYQGGLARTFWRCQGTIDTYLRECPDWARRVAAELRA